MMRLWPLWSEFTGVTTVCVWILETRCLSPSVTFGRAAPRFRRGLTSPKHRRVAYVCFRTQISSFRCVRQRVKAKVDHPDMPGGLSCSAGPRGPDGRYETPPASELQRLMWTKKGTSSSHLDEVYHRIYIGDM